MTTKPTYLTHFTVSGDDWGDTEMIIKATVAAMRGFVPFPIDLATLAVDFEWGEDSSVHVKLSADISGDYSE